MNIVILKGNLGQAPTTNTTQTGRAVTNFSLATNESYKDATGKKIERVQWHRIVTWGALAENCQKYLDKGSAVLVTGKVQSREYTDKEGTKRYTTEIVASSVEFLDRKGAGKTEQNTEVVEDLGEADEITQALGF